MISQNINTTQMMQRSSQWQRPYDKH